jgi:LAO/AO transport system kinase
MVLTASSANGSGIAETWQMVENYAAMTRVSGYYEARRKEQALQAFTDTVEESIRQRFYHDPNIINRLPSLKSDILSGIISPYAAAKKLIGG